MVVMLELEMLWHGKLAFLLVWYLKLYAKLLSVFMIVVMVEEPLYVACILVKLTLDMLLRKASLGPGSVRCASYLSMW